jgi:hypothetical protein
MKIQLFAGQETSVAKRGWFFRILSAEKDIVVRIARSNDGKQFYKGTLAAGIGIDFLSNAAAFDFVPFDTAYIYSETDQLVDLWIEEVKADDDRLSGNFDINAALSVAATSAKYNTASRLTFSGETEVLPVLASRRAAIIQPSAPVYQGSTDGVILEGPFSWENQSALVLIPVSGSVTIRISEDWG